MSANKQDQLHDSAIAGTAPDSVNVAQRDNVIDVSTYWERRKARIKEAGFVEPLASFIDIDLQGHCSFSYAMLSGGLQSVLDRALDLVDDAKRAQSAKARQECVQAAFHWLQTQRDRYAEIDRLWLAYLEAQKAASGDAP